MRAVAASAITSPQQPQPSPPQPPPPQPPPPQPPHPQPPHPLFTLHPSPPTPIPTSTLGRCALLQDAVLAAVRATAQANHVLAAHALARWRHATNPLVAALLRWRRAAVHPSQLLAAAAARSDVSGLRRGLRALSRRRSAAAFAVAAAAANAAARVHSGAASQLAVLRRWALESAALRLRRGVRRTLGLGRMASRLAAWRCACSQLQQQALVCATVAQRRARGAAARGFALWAGRWGAEHVGPRLMSGKSLARRTLAAWWAHVLARLCCENTMLRVAATWQLAAAKRRWLLAAWWHAERRRRERATRAARARQSEMQNLATLALALERWLWPRRRAERLAALRLRMRCRHAFAALHRPAAVQHARRRLETLARLRLQRRCFGGLHGFASVERRYRRLLRPLQGLPESAVQHEHARPSRLPLSPSKQGPSEPRSRAFMAGVRKQKALEITEELARRAEQTGDAYEKLLAEGAHHGDNDDCRRAAMSYREAIALRPNKPEAYLTLGGVLASSGHQVEAAQRFLEAKELLPAGSALWAVATTSAFESLRLKANSEAPKPEWWNDKGLKALSVRVVRAAPNGQTANHMRAMVLTGNCAGAWEVGTRSAAELKEAATHLEQAAALCIAPAMKAEYTRLGCQALRQAGAMSTHNGRT